MSSQPRPRKQRFPRMDRRRPLGSCTRGIPIEEEFLSDDDSFYFHKRPRQVGSSEVRPLRPCKPPYSSKDSLPNCRVDKRARDEHNEQERSRRRELAVIYELIRCSFSEDDLRYLEPYSGPKSIDKLSYPQVLQVAYQLLREEQHNLIIFERTLDEMKRIEKELIQFGLSVPQRPFYPSVSDGYRKVVQVVDNLLKYDKSARTADGVYEVTPAERAALGNHQLAALRPRPCGTYSDTVSHVVPTTRLNYSGQSFGNQTGRDDQVIHHSREFDPVHLNTTGHTSIWHKVGRKLRRCSSAASMSGLDSHTRQSAERCSRRDWFVGEASGEGDLRDVKPSLNSLVSPMTDGDDVKPLLNSLMPSVKNVKPDNDDADVMINYLHQID